MIKKLILIILAAHLSSCIVLHEEYFLPDADGAIIEKESCRGKVGADNQLLYNLENIEVKLNVWEYEGVTRLGITFKIFGDGSVIWPSQIVELNADNNTKYSGHPLHESKRNYTTAATNLENLRKV